MLNIGRVNVEKNDFTATLTKKRRGLGLHSVLSANISMS